MLGLTSACSSSASGPGKDAATDSRPLTAEAGRADAKSSSPDAGRRDGSPDGVATDAYLGSPDTPADKSPGLPDAGLVDGQSTFVPPMPNVATDPTLMDVTDFGTSSGFKIILDYRYDDAGFMTRDKRLVLRTAAASWEQFIGSDFAAIPSGTYVRARDPEDVDGGGMNFTVPYALDDLVIFVGSLPIDGPGKTLAHASSSNTNQGMTAEFAAMLAARYRGNPFQPWVASVGFDKEEPFFVDTTMDTANDIPREEFDLYSVALHEFGHVLGTGQSAAFKAMVANATFTGAKTVALFGGPVPLTPGGDHVLNSVRFEGRTLVMDKSDLSGERNLINRLDLTMLEDQGYTIRW